VSAASDTAGGGQLMSTTKLSVLAVQMPKGLADSIRRLAEQHEHTVQGEIRRALRGHVDQELRRQERLSVPEPR
jgi:hypothetical protein